MRMPCWWDRLWWRIGLAVLAFLLAWWAATAHSEELKPGNLVILDTSSIQSFKDFFAATGATETRLDNSAQAKVMCERRGWGWAGTWKGPSGAAMNFCVNYFPLSPSQGEFLCRWAGLAWHQEPDPMTVVCMKSELGAGGMLFPEPKTRLRKIGSVDPPPSMADPDNARSWLDPALSFPARECKRREALHNTDGRKAVLFPKPWSFSTREGEEGIEATCWNPDKMRETLQARDPDGWEATWNTMVQKPARWKPASEEMMDYLCQKTFSQRLAPIWAEPMTPAVVQRRFAHRATGWWWCE